eukprot:2663147-Lingulodinium_polyedra.AAC.1
MPERQVLGCRCATPAAFTLGCGRGLETYNLITCRFFTHAMPTLFNAGTPSPQMQARDACGIHAG